MTVTLCLILRFERQIIMAFTVLNVSAADIAEGILEECFTSFGICVCWEQSASC